MSLYFTETKNITADDWAELSHNDILSLEDLNLKKEILSKYKSALSYLSSSDAKYYIRPDKSVNDIYNDILTDDYNASINNSSSSLFPNDTIEFYPRILYQKSKKDRVCHYSGAIIKEGSYYINYRPMIHNLSTKETFVLDKSITCEPCYEEKLPMNLLEFELMISRIENAYEYDDELWYNFNCNYGNNTLSLKKLRK